jgi:ADP-heptose:LPS heptosyltransferase
MGNRALLIAAGGGFGDTFLATLCASALRSKFEAVDAVVLPAHLDALLHGADVDGVFSAMQPFDELATELRRRRYAVAVVTWANLMTASLAARSGAEVRVGQARRLYSFLFNKRVVVRSELGDTTTHWSEILLDYPRALGCETSVPWPRFEIRDDEEREAAAVLRELGIEGTYLMLHPVSALAPRRPFWPVEGWRALISRLGRRYGIPVVVAGSKADAPIADRIVAGNGARSAAGRTTFGGFAALARRARALVGMHSAPMHIAGSVGARTVSIFPLRVDFPDRWRPLGPAVALVRNTYPCPPGRGHFMETCATYDCVAKLDLDAIDAAIGEVLTAPQPSLRVPSRARDDSTLHV